MADELSVKHARALNRKISSSIRNEAGRRGSSPELVRYQVVFECFLRRLFASGGKWVLTGGGALLMRRGDGRFTKDLDLSRAEVWLDKTEVEQELSRIGRRHPDLDPFTFDVTAVATTREDDPAGYSGPALKIGVTVRLGSAEFSRFKIDVTTRRHTQEPVSQITVDPFLERVLVATMKASI